MASVYRHSQGKPPTGLPFFTDENGKQRHRSTKTTNKTKAISCAERWQRGADKVQYLDELLDGKTPVPDKPVFPKLSKTCIRGDTGLKRSLGWSSRLASNKKTVIRATKGGKGRNFNPLTFHSLRHTFVSLMANRGVSQELREKILGPTSNVHERYTHIEIKTLKLASNYSKPAPHFRGAELWACGRLSEICHLPLIERVLRPGSRTSAVIPLGRAMPVSTYFPVFFQ